MKRINPCVKQDQLIHPQLLPTPPQNLERHIKNVCVKINYPFTKN